MKAAVVASVLLALSVTGVIVVVIGWYAGQVDAAVTGLVVAMGLTAVAAAVGTLIGWILAEADRP